MKNQPSQDGCIIYDQKNLSKDEYRFSRLGNVDIDRKEEKFPSAVNVNLVTLCNENKKRKQNFDAAAARNLRHNIKANLRCQVSHYKMASPLICGVCFGEYKDFKTLEKHLYVCQKNAKKSKLVADDEITETEQIKNNVQGKTFLKILRCVYPRNFFIALFQIGIL